MPQTKLFELPYSVQGKTTIYGIVKQRSTGLFLDYTTGAFVYSPTNKFCPAVEDAILKGVYSISESRFAWTDGYYLCVFYDQAGGSPNPATDPVLGSAQLPVSADAEVSYPAVASGYTYDDIKTDALIGLKGTGKAAYKDPIMNKIVNDAVQIARKIAAMHDPSMVQSSLQINVVADNAGPYNISNDFEYAVSFLNEYMRELGDSYRGEFNVPLRRCRPDGYWIEGFAPAAIYFNATPDKAYAWTLYYIATRARVTDFSTSVPLPAFFREPLVEFVTKFAAQTQEYNTVDEDQKIQFLSGLITEIMINRRPEIRVNISGDGFGGQRGNNSGFRRGYI